MTATQIRALITSASDDTDNELVALVEIAAQLAELNENLTRINYIRIDE